MNWSCVSARATEGKSKPANQAGHQRQPLHSSRSGVQANRNSTEPRNSGASTNTPTSWRVQGKNLMAYTQLLTCPLHSARRVHHAPEAMAGVAASAARACAVVQCYTDAHIMQDRSKQGIKADQEAHRGTEHKQRNHGRRTRVGTAAQLWTCRERQRRSGAAAVAATQRSVKSSRDKGIQCKGMIQAGGTRG